MNKWRWFFFSFFLCTGVFAQTNSNHVPRNESPPREMKLTEFMEREGWTASDLARGLRPDCDWGMSSKRKPEAYRLVLSADQKPTTGSQGRPMNRLNTDEAFDFFEHDIETIKTPENTVGIYTIDLPKNDVFPAKLMFKNNVATVRLSKGGEIHVTGIPDQNIGPISVYKIKVDEVHIDKFVMPYQLILGVDFVDAKGKSRREEWTARITGYGGFEGVIGDIKVDARGSGRLGPFKMENVGVRGVEVDVPTQSVVGLFVGGTKKYDDGTCIAIGIDCGVDGDQNAFLRFGLKISMK